MGKRLPRAQLFGLREQLAQESARLMIEHGIADYGFAKRKAAERLAVSNAGALPSNAQIEICLAERQRIFEPDAHAVRLDELRRLALDLMRSLAVFQPRLVGPVLKGTATIASGIELHLFAANPELVADVLQSHGISPANCERRYRFGGRRTAVAPGFKFGVGDERIVAIVFPENGLREAPLSHIDRRPMERASIRRVEQLLRN